jgi:glycosyltransferase involved in cell wall biosynthesis
MKKPVITAETPAIKEVFTDRKNIILCQAANSFSLRDAIIELINDKNLTRKISDGGYNLILDYFSHIKVSGVLSNHLLELLESGNDL